MRRLSAGTSVLACTGTVKLIAANTSPGAAIRFDLVHLISPILPKRNQLGKSDCFEDRYSERRPQLVPGTDFLRALVAVQQSNAPFTNESRFRQIHFRTFLDRDVGRLVAKTNALSGQNSTLT